MLKRPIESLQSLEFQKPTRYHADIEIKGKKVITKHYSTYSVTNAQAYFTSFGKVLKFWRD
jgi:ABC-type transporter MlaC component